MISLRLASLLFLVLLAGPASASGEVAWKPFDQGLQDASAGKKYGFVSVYTDWCGYCRKLETESLRDKAVTAELRKNFVSIKLNAESEESVTWKGRKTDAS